MADRVTIEVEGVEYTVSASEKRAYDASIAAGFAPIIALQIACDSYHDLQTVKEPTDG